MDKYRIGGVFEKDCSTPRMGFNIELEEKVLFIISKKGYQWYLITKMEKH